jgi:hypothetical protein
VKDENNDLLADSHNILNRWKNCYSLLLNVHSVSDVRQIEIHTAEPTVPDPGPSEVEIAIANLKKYKLHGSDQIPAEMTQAGETLWSKIHKLVNSNWNKKELPNHWTESIIVPIYKKGDRIDCSICCGISLLSALYKMLSNILPLRLSPCVNEIIGHHQCGFQSNRSIMDQIFCIHQILQENGNTRRQYISYSYTSR